MKLKKCFGKKDGYMHKCHEDREDYPSCDRVAQCYRAFNLLKRGCPCVILTKPVDGLSYHVGNVLPVSEGQAGLIWHVYNQTIKLPKGSYKEVHL